MKLDLSDANLTLKPAKADRLTLITCQKKFWIDFNGTQHYVNLMPINYVRNLRRWMKKRAYLIHDYYLWRWYLGVHTQYMGDAAQDAFDLAASMAFDENPITWIRQQPLYRQLLIREWRARNV